MAVKRAAAILRGKRWYGGEPVTGVRVLERVGDIEHVLAEVGDGAAYQLLVGSSGDDEVCAPAVAERVLGRPVRAVRALGAEQSNSSVVVDDEVLVKVFRKLRPGSNPDVEVPAALAGVGFDDVVAPIASWHEEGFDLAVAVPFLGAVVDGWSVALAHGGDPTELASTIGTLTARLHGALAKAFGVQPAERDALVATHERACADASMAPAAATSDALRSLSNPGVTTRVHGDYHLGQLLQHDSPRGTSEPAGGRWYVIDFEGEPNRTLAERRAAAPPLKDLAGMLRSFAYAAAVGGHGEEWEQAAVDACRTAYLDAPEAAALLPSDPGPVLDAYLLEKAVYELAYERGFRPEWAWIPEKAVRELGGGSRMDVQKTQETQGNQGQSGLADPGVQGAAVPADRGSGTDLRAHGDLLVAGVHGDPHAVLGRHGDQVRAWRPDALAVAAVVGDARHPLALVHPGGLWSGDVPGSTGGAGVDAPYLLATTWTGGAESVDQDAYAAWPTLGEVDLHLIGEGRHRRLWDVLGAHHRTHDGIEGTAFAVWAPNARGVSVVGDFNFWDGRTAPMRTLGASGVWELFLPGVAPGACYKLEIRGADGTTVQRADPMARWSEVPPGTASIVCPDTTHRWQDEAWLERRRTTDWMQEPTSVYEVHLGSWRHVPEEGDRSLTYLELADQLPAYVADMGFTHVELLPPAEHPFGGSWGYQVTGYFAPSSRFGTPDDFRVLIDAFHARGIGVLIDWVPAHFPKDVWALAHFDGTALYEHADPRQGEHPTGAPWSSTSAGTRCGASSSPAACTGSRSCTSTACGSTRWRRCCTSTTRARKASGCRIVSGAGRTSKRSSS